MRAAEVPISPDPRITCCLLSSQDRPQEKPICIFISNVDQLRAAAPPFSPLLWEFMEHVYPGGIGCIVKKGQWLKTLGGFAGISSLVLPLILQCQTCLGTCSLADLGPVIIAQLNPSCKVIIKWEDCQGHHELRGKGKK